MTCDRQSFSKLLYAPPGLNLLYAPPGLNLPHAPPGLRWLPALALAAACGSGSADAPVDPPPGGAGKGDSIHPDDNLDTMGRLRVTVPDSPSAPYADYALSFAGKPIEAGVESLFPPGAGCLQIRLGTRKVEQCGIELAVGELVEIELGALLVTLPQTDEAWGYHWFQNDGLRFSAGEAVPFFIDEDDTCLGIRTTSADTVQRCGFELDPQTVTEVTVGGFRVRTPPFEAQQVEDLLIAFTEYGYLELGFRANAFYPVFEGEACAASPPTYGSSVERHCVHVAAGTTETVDGSVVLVQAPSEYYAVDFGPKVRICLGTQETPGYRLCPFAKPTFDLHHAVAFVVVSDDYALTFSASDAKKNHVFDVLEQHEALFHLPPFHIEDRTISDPRGRLAIRAPERELPSPPTGICEQVDEHFLGVADPEFSEPVLYGADTSQFHHLELLDGDVELVALADVPFAYATNSFSHPFTLSAGETTELEVNRLDIHHVTVDLNDTGQQYTTPGKYRIERWDGSAFSTRMKLRSCQNNGDDTFSTGYGVDVPPGIYEITIDYKTPEAGPRSQVWECDFLDANASPSCEMTVGP